MIAKTNDTPGGRLPLRDPSALTAEQRSLYDSILDDYLPWAENIGFRITTSDGQLIGPFNAFLLNPKITEALLAFDGALKSYCSFSARVREVIIISVGAVWGSNYELYTHSMLAHSAGISAEAAKSLASGEIPADLADEEVLAARVATEMSKNHRIDNALFAEAEKTFGMQGLYEMATLIGEFSATCAVLNLFDVPAPGAEPRRT